MRTSTAQLVAAALLAVTCPAIEAAAAVSWTSAASEGSEIGRSPPTVLAEIEMGGGFTLLGFESPGSLKSFLLGWASDNPSESAEFYVSPSDSGLGLSEAMQCAPNCGGEVMNRILAAHPMNLGFQKVELRQLDTGRQTVSGLLDSHAQGNFLAMHEFQSTLAAAANPEPGSLALLAVGLTTMLLVARRRTRWA